MQPDDLLKLDASNTQGKPVPLSAFASTEVGQGCPANGALQRLSGHAHLGQPCPGYSTGAAMAEMEKLAGPTAEQGLASSGPDSRAKKTGEARSR